MGRGYEGTGRRAETWASPESLSNNESVPGK